MPIAEKAAALLEALRPQDFDALAPAARRRFAALCRRTADLAEPGSKTPKAGVVAELHGGRET